LWYLNCNNDDENDDENLFERIGQAGQIATHGIVFAQLITKNQNCGLQVSDLFCHIFQNTLTKQKKQ
jgi:hypothetical protein